MLVNIAVAAFIIGIGFIVVFSNQSKVYSEKEKSPDKAPNENLLMVGLILILAAIIMDIAALLMRPPV
jgi:hypothetical protein